MNNIVFIPAQGLEFEKWVNHDIPAPILARKYGKEGIQRLMEQIGAKIWAFYIDPAYRPAYAAITPGATMCVFVNKDSSSIVGVGTVASKLHDAEMARVLWPAEWAESRADIFLLSGVFKPIAPGIVKYCDCEGNSTRPLTSPVVTEASEIIAQYRSIQAFVDYLTGFSTLDGHKGQAIHLIHEDGASMEARDAGSFSAPSVENAELVKAQGYSTEFISSESTGEAESPRLRPVLRQARSIDDRLADQLAKWKADLINLDRRNRLLYYKPTVTSTVEFIEPVASSLFERLFSPRSRGFRIIRSPTDRGDFAANHSCGTGEARSAESSADQLRKCLFNLNRKASQLWLDRGIWSLYLGCGILEWQESTAMSTDIALTPVLMVPVELECDGDQAGYTVTKSDEEIAMNPALVAKFRLDFDIDLSLDEQLEDAPLGDILESVRKKVSRKGWKVRDDAILGAFTFHKDAMYKDLDYNSEIIKSNPILRSLVLGKDSGYEYGFDSVPLGDLDRIAPPEEMVTILDADSSQRQAIVAAREGRSFVLDGPPGTGKSQTIANIIAELMARKKSVLFVSEKAAALEVVKKRLDNAGLSDFILELHSHKATRKEVARNLGAALDAQPPHIGAMADEEINKLRRNRKDLSAWSDAVNEVRPDLGINLCEAIGIVSSCAETSTPPASAILPATDRGEWHSKILETAEDLARAWGPVERQEDFVWNRPSLTEWNALARDRVCVGIERAIEAVEKAREVGKNMAVDLGVARPSSLSELEAILAAERLLVARPSISAELLGVVDLGAQNMEIEGLAHHASALLAARTALDERAGIGWRSLPPDMATEYRQSIAAIEKCDHAWSPPESADTRRLEAQSAFHAEYKNRGVRIFDAAKEFRAFFSMETKAPTIGMARELHSLGKALAKGNRPPKKWINDEWINGYARSFQDAKTSVGNLSTLSHRISPVLSESVAELDLAAICGRFKEYGFFRHLDRRYRADMASLSLHAVSGKFKWRDRSIVDTALVFKKELENFNRREEEWGESFGPYWKSRETDFELIEAAAALAQTGIDWFRMGFELAPIRSVFSGENAEVLRLISGYTEILETELVTLDARIALACPESRSLIDNLGIDAFTDNCRDLSTVLECLAALLSSAKACCTPVASFGALEPVAIARETVAIEESFFEQHNERFSSLFGGDYAGEHTDWSRLSNSIEWALTMRETFPSSFSTEAAAAIISAPDRSKEIERAMKTMRDSIESVAVNVDRGSPLGKRLSGLDRIESLLELFTRMRDHIEEIPEALRHFELQEKLASMGLREAVGAAVDLRLPAGNVSSFLDSSFLIPWIDEQFKNDPRLKNASYRERQSILDEFRNLDRKYIKKSASFTIRSCTAMRPVDLRGNWGIIKHQAGLQKRHKPVKKLMEEAGAEIQQLKPCFMMSPLSVSQFIPANMKFDVVIFDEASQVRPADSINSIYRGGQLIVAGDQRQLPPTSFFEQSQDSGEDYEDDSEPESWESVLDLCTSSASFKEIPLLWHYRSRHEHLIAFSNYSFYDGRLVTFPAALHEGEDVGVEFYYVPDGRYKRNGSRDNAREAEIVRDRVLHHLERHPEMTIGIVALSEPQAAMIEQILERALGNRPELRERMRKDRLDGLFIKNLETVQGDERDLIVLSIGYGPDETGKLTQNFGPMNQRNGWRRLNVAITRARKRVEVVSSVMPEQINYAGGERSIGHLKRYLEYAAAGKARMRVVNDMFGMGLKDRESPFEDSVAHTIVKMGFAVEPQLGCSGYRIDLAVRHPGDPSRFVLAVECDGESYHSAKVVRDRDRLRQEVLEGLGWDVHRIWSSSWYQNRKEQEELLRERIEKAIESHPVQDILNTSSPAERVLTVASTSVIRGENSSLGNMDSHTTSADIGLIVKKASSDCPVSTEHDELREIGSASELIAYLESQGVSVDNHRLSGGGIWVYKAKKEFESLAKYLNTLGIGYRYYPDGRRNHAGEQYELDPGKRLV